MISGDIPQGQPLVGWFTRLRTERELATRIERAFAIDEAAIERVRAAVVSPSSALANDRRRAGGRPGFGRAASLGFALTVALGVGVAAVATAPHSQLAVGRLATSVDWAASAYAVLDRSDASLVEAQLAAQSGDARVLGLQLAGYRADLGAIKESLRAPGADLVSAAARLRTQAIRLSGMSTAIPAEYQGLYRDVTNELDSVLASLPGGPSGVSSPGDGHRPDGPPGNGNGNGNPGGNGNGADNGKAGGNGNADPVRNDNEGPHGR